MSSTTITHHRARVAALSRSRSDQDPEYVGARRALAAANIEQAIEKAVSAAPALTDEQVTRITELLRSGSAAA